MKSMGIRGIVRGKPHKTTVSDKKAPYPLDKVNRQFRVPAPNMLWVSDFTYVATWRGFAYVAFVIDAYARFFIPILAFARIRPMVRTSVPAMSLVCAPNTCSTRARTADLVRLLALPCSVSGLPRFPLRWGSSGRGRAVWPPSPRSDTPDRLRRPSQCCLA